MRYPIIQSSPSTCPVSPPVQSNRPPVKSIHLCKTFKVNICKSKLFINHIFIFAFHTPGWKAVDEVGPNLKENSNVGSDLSYIIAYDFQRFLGFLSKLLLSIQGDDLTTSCTNMNVLWVPIIFQEICDIFWPALARQ